VRELGSIQNLIWRTDDPRTKWIERATERIGDWRSFVRSVYMRWAITINALHIARDRYRDRPDAMLAVDVLRPSSDGPQRVHLAVWDPPTAAANYDASIPLLAAYGVQDLYGALEEIVFALYELFLADHPEEIIGGPQFRPLRALRRSASDGPEQAEAWAGAWAQRLEQWRRNRSYDGLHRVFASFWAAAGLQRPSWYALSDIEDWTRTIETIGEIRHLIVHGENAVSDRLGDLCAAQPNLGLEFRKGERLEVHLVDLMIVEQFLDRLLTTINLSMFEMATGEPLPVADDESPSDATAAAADWAGRRQGAGVDRPS
jgi:hypothetical protein